MIVQVFLAASAGENSLDAFNRVIKDIPETESFLTVVGPFDYALILRTREKSHSQAMLGDKISKLPGIHQTKSIAVMKTVLKRIARRLADLCHPLAIISRSNGSSSG